MSGTLLAAAILLPALGGVLALAARERGDLLAAVLVAAGSAAGLAVSVPVLLGGPPATVQMPWAIPGGALALRVDGVSAFFLLPVLLVGPLGAIYGLEYFPARAHPRAAPIVRLFYGLATGALVLVMSAHNALLFLAAWEVVGLASFFLVGAEGHAESREAAWVYLVATHAATLALFVMFGILRTMGGSYGLDALPEGLAASPAGRTVFLLGLCAFGLKAGLMPLHVWLPGAHAAAPSHVSALMSGVIIKMGIYGLVRVLHLFPDPPPAWGLAVLGLGLVSGVLGVAFALGQHDLKRLLAYHSVENIGIIAMGFGLCLVGRATGRTDLAVLGAAAGALHVWNHALFKSLLFYGAGAVVHATGTRDLERQGGLLGRMPVTAALFLLGSVAICGLPPLNGFVSELFLYSGLLRTVAGEPAPELAVLGAMGVLGLAAIGALALACFVKAFGVVFLGSPREPRNVAEVGWPMRLPGAVLGAACLAIGLLPAAAGPILAAPILELAPAAGPDALEALVPFGPWTSATGVLAVLLLAASLTVVGLRRRAPERATVTWDCGYAAPTARMQYTGSSLAAGFVHAFRWALRPRGRGTSPAGPFPLAASRQSHVPEVVLDLGIRPALRSIAWLFAWSAYLQSGRVQAYIFYVLATLVVLLCQL